MTLGGAADESTFTATDALHVLFPLACGLAAALAIHFLAREPSPGAELLLGLSVMHAFFVDLVYFKDINRFDAGRS